MLFHRSEAELTATLSEKQSLEAEVADARAQLAKVQAWQAKTWRAIGISPCNGPAAERGARMASVAWLISPG